MNLHEYQAKTLFKEYGMPVPEYIVAHSSDDVRLAAEKLTTEQVILKVQVHAGARVKAGGVKMVDTPREAEDYARAMLGTRLVTEQSDKEGQPVNTILVEEICDIKTQLYVAIVIDRSSQGMMVIASAEGGMAIEQVARETPEKILKAFVDPKLGITPDQCSELAIGLGLAGEHLEQFSQMLPRLCKLFVDKDMALVEVNPLAVNSKGELVCLDGKVTIDRRALYRQQELVGQRDLSQDHQRDSHALAWGFDHMALQGNIGCMVNGHGLAMATMDMIKLEGAHLANVLDVGGHASVASVAEALKVISTDTGVKSILINIIGGIVRCDIVAKGIIAALSDRHSESSTDIPLVVRLDGNLATEARALLEGSGLKFLYADDLNDGVQKVVELAECTV